MKLYVIQIHNTESEQSDQLFIFQDFENMKSEFSLRFKRLSRICNKTVSEEQPTMDDTGCVYGSFRLECADGSFTVGTAYDYHVLDER